MNDSEDYKPPEMSVPDAGAWEQLGEYRLREMLGEGGMGRVYRAEQSGLDRQVAIKILSETCAKDDQFVRRFLQEMKAAAKVDHPNVVRAYDARKIQGQPALVMEYVDGPDLAKLVEQTGPLPVADACEIASQVAEGLKDVHVHRMVHRDIKPSNLILSRSGQVKILDLGLAHVHSPSPVAEGMTIPGQAMGTPDYMAPEQASDSSIVDIRADLYSLGCTLFCLLTGQPPFASPAYAGFYEKITAHARDPAPSVRQFRSDVPKKLLAVLNRMLAKDPEQRFVSPTEVVENLAPFTSGADLPTLLATAEGPETQVMLSKPTGAETSAVTKTLRTHESRRRPRTPIAGPHWRRIHLSVLAVFLLAAGAGLTLFLIWPDTPAPVAPGRPWLVLSWSPPRSPRELTVRKPDLWLFDNDGEQRLRVTDNPDFVDLQPNLSPDGRRIAFIRAASPRGANTVCVCNTDGSDLRELATTTTERLLSPIWISNSRIYYTVHVKEGRRAHAEVWQVDIETGKPQLAFPFKAASGLVIGVVTDVAPDGQHLAVVGQERMLPGANDVYITDLRGNMLATVWEDPADDFSDARAVWSPDGQKIAWHRCLEEAKPQSGSVREPSRHGVGLARLQGDGTWTVSLPERQDTFLSPIAWSKDSRSLLCVRLDESSVKYREATLVLLDTKLGTSSELFELEGHWAQGSAWGLCRQGDWAVLSDDVPLPPPSSG
jgi:serine/threonine protein kinase